MIINKNVMTLSNEELAVCREAEPATIGHFHNFGFSTVPFFTSIVRQLPLQAPAVPP